MTQNKQFKDFKGNSDRQVESIESLSIVTAALLLFTFLKTLWLLIDFFGRQFVHSSQSALNLPRGVVRFFTIMGDVLSTEFAELHRNSRHRKKNIPLVEFQPNSSRGWKHISAYFISIIALFLLLAGFQIAYAVSSLKTTSEDALRQGFSHLMQGVQFAKEYDTMRSVLEFKRSEQLFSYANDVIRSTDPLAFSIARSIPFIGGYVQDAQNLLLAGDDLSRAGGIVMEYLRSNGSQLTILSIQELLSLISPLITEADSSLQSIKSHSIPERERESFVRAVNAVHDARTTIETASSAVDVIVDSIGTHTLRRYLILFQNNAELRPTGGFIGSYALIDVMNGEIKNVEIPPGGPYDLRANFYERLNPPEPLRLIASQWEFQDANWWADFPTSARKLLWFYEKAEGPTVDGVIAINASLLPRLLTVLGPLTLQAYDKTLTETNALAELQRAVELEYDRGDNKPKQIIADALPLLIDLFSKSNPDTLYQILPIVIDAVSSKDIQFYFRNETYQSVASNFDLTGEMKHFSPDYNMIVSTNIGGAKTDAVISTNVNRTLRVDADGTIIISLDIKRSHNGSAGDLFTGVQNNDYLRFYVPAGSQLVSATGFGSTPLDALKPLLPNHIDDADLRAYQQQSLHSVDMNVTTWNENDKSVFAGWLFTKPSSVSNVNITYRLPYKFDELFQSGERGLYALLLQRQSGSTIASYTVKFEIPSRYKLEWKDDSSCNEENGGRKLVCSSNEFLADRIIGFIMIREK